MMLSDAVLACLKQEDVTDFEPPENGCKCPIIVKELKSSVRTNVMFVVQAPARRD